jgi:hypothetical protein
MTNQSLNSKLHSLLAWSDHGVGGEPIVNKFIGVGLD